MAPTLERSTLDLPTCDVQEEGGTMRATGPCGRSWSRGRPVGDGLRVVTAGLLLAWGVSLGFSGLGLGQSVAARWFNAYWTLPFLVYGLVGLLWPRAVGLGFWLSAVVVAGSVLLLLQSVPLAGMHLASLVGAAIVVVVALFVLTRRGGWHW
jgi:hypothetical protein